MWDFSFFPHRKASLIIHFLGSCLPIQIGWGCGAGWWVGGVVDTHTNITNVRHKLGYIRKTKTSLSLVFFFSTLHRLSESFHLSWHPEDSLKEPYVSSASSQQQSQDHHALLSYHANEAGSRPVVCRQFARERRQTTQTCTLTLISIFIIIMNTWIHP